MKLDPKIRFILKRLHVDSGELIPLAGDASARRFFRLPGFPFGTKRSMILIVFPPEAERQEIIRYLKMAKGLKKAGLPVPEVYRFDIADGFFLVEDGGDNLLQDLVRGRNPINLYQQAIDLMIEMRSSLNSVIAGLNPCFDQETFSRELNFFLTHTLEGYYGGKFDEISRSEFGDFFRIICQELSIQPQVFCHRDYHSRNLLVQAERLIMIDFQDGRLGPYTYDLVSLLEDPYTALAVGVRDELKKYYLYRENQVSKKNFSGDFYRDYDMMSIQRLLKAAGTFGYMYMVRGKPEYTRSLPRIFKRVDEIIRGYPELRGLDSLLKKYTTIKPSGLDRQPGKINHGAQF